MQWTAYNISPIDWMWEFLPTLEDVASQFARHDAELEVAGAEKFEERYLPRLFEHFDTAKELAHDAGWEGDYRSDARPRLLFLPGDNEFQYAFVWKQDNNGSTFVVSPVKLPWLQSF